MLPVDQQMREDAALGAAWRRCEATLPEGASFELIRRIDGKYTASYLLQTNAGMGTVLSTPAAALTALAEALEARQEAER